MRTEQAIGELSSYRQIFRISGATQFVAASLIARLPSSTICLATIILVSETTGSYALAGSVAAGGALSYAFVAPGVCRQVDRAGQGRTLQRMAWIFMVTGAMFIIAAQLNAPDWVLCLTGGAFGAATPPLGAMIRARWSHLAGPDRGLLRSAYSFESVADQVIFVVGPLLVSAVVMLHPAAGVATVAALGACGSLMLAAQRRTEPPVSPIRTTAPRFAFVPGLRLMCAIYLWVAAMFATFELSTVAFTEEDGRPWMVGAIIATHALGGAVGGLWYGARSWNLSLEHRYLFALAAMVAGVAPVWAMPSVTALWAVSFVSGVLVAPAVIAGYSLVRQGVPAESLTESIAWTGTGAALGKALGVLTAGAVIDVHGPRWGYALSLACGCTAVIIGLAGRNQLRAMAHADEMRVTGQVKF